jgi:MoaA/NifB/PqqE/SkfB family radical SAM enzyme
MRLNDDSDSYHDFSMATFIITYECPISCPMCFFACGPNRNEVMPKDLALRILEEINELKMKTIGIAGGEPFLQVDLMHEVIRTASLLGLTTIVVTNAYWAVSKEAALDKLGDLKESGLNRIQFSLDDQHQRFIPIDRVANALEAAIELSIEDVKLLGCSKGNSERFKYQLFYLQEILGTSINRTDLVDRPRISHRYFEDPEQVRYTFQDLKNTESLDLSIGKPGDCLTELMVDVNGDLYPCCNNFVGRIGNVSECSLQSIVEYLRHNKYFDIIKRESPFGLAKNLDETLDTGFSNGQYGSWCELCAQIFQNDHLRDLLVSENPSILNCSKD